MGRKALASGEASKGIAVRFPLSDHERIEAAAKSYGRTVGEFVRLAVMAATNGALDPVGVIETEPVKAMRRHLPKIGGRSPKAREAGDSRVASHKHRGASMVRGASGQIVVCECGARQIGGSWVEVTADELRMRKSGGGDRGDASA